MQNTDQNQLAAPFPIDILLADGRACNSQMHPFFRQIARKKRHSPLAMPLQYSAHKRRGRQVAP